MKFDAFFKAARGHEQEPFDYQRRLAGGDAGCESRLINIPTGLGKTAAVMLAWLWNRVALNRPEWPRRLAYCLPMRTLVEQTQGEVETWLKNLLTKAEELGLSAEAKNHLSWLADHSPVVLMGGAELDSMKTEWDLHPERPAILIGTQDMLLSRALNRGYGMSRYRWPMHFGLLNNDCLWVMDETQLMGVGVETSAQLDAFRTTAGGILNGSQTWWMSATLAPGRLATVDHAAPAGGWPFLTLENAVSAMPEVCARFEAKKPLGQAPVVLTPDAKKNYAAQLAKFIADEHQPESLTLVVLNTVPRAQDVYWELKKLNRSEPLALIHSRFRPGDRHRQEALLHANSGRIIIATQAVEAGVDVSARTLITELAPWSALVQRFGRATGVVSLRRLRPAFSGSR